MLEQVLIYSRFPKAQLVGIGEHYDLLDAAGKPPAEKFGAEQLKPIRAMITAGGQSIPNAVLDSLPSLGAIICYGTGYDGVDLAELKKRNIALGNSPGANAASVADLAMTLMLAATRRLLPASDYVRSGDWAGSKPSPAMRPPLGMTGRKIGIYGMGEIGRKIAARCASFETEVGYHSRSKHDVPYQYFPTLAALAEWCNVLMVAVRAGPDTQHIIGAEILQKLGAGGTIVNISRGSVIDQSALVSALESHAVAAAGLDVYEKEPHVPDVLTRLPNVVLTPHIGGHTIEGHRAMQDCVIANLDAFFAGQPLRYPVK
ncbi:MAG: 2-hydroxyacid dehydrogenase [Afipia sp.]|nr:2-hydroxyacid dehydrogenase [Afipia sp.]